MSSDEGSNGDELDLKDISGDWRCVVQIVRWWGCCTVWSTLSSFPFSFLVTLCMLFFSTWNFISYLYHSKMFLILWGPIRVLPDLWSFSCSPFLVELTAPSFLLPRTSLLFHYSTGSVFLGVFLPPTWPWPLWADGLYLTHFRSLLADAAHSPSYFLKWTEWLTS